MSERHVSAPGRICLFGEHQDYLGLPVIAAAVNLRIGVTATPKSSATFVINMPDIGESLEIDPNAEQTYAHHRDYLRSAVNVLRREGLSWRQGYLLAMHGDIPINAGVSSSSAMVIMWLRFLLEMGEPKREFSDEDLARWGYQAEVAEFGDPGGMMDHYCAALGGALWIDTRPPFRAERLSLPLAGIVLGHSLEPKATIETLRRTRNEVSEAAKEITRWLPNFDLSKTPMREAEEALNALSPNLRRRLFANLRNRDLTLEAKANIPSGDQAALGKRLYAHHEQLRDGLDLSTPKIERMMDAAIGAGALGGKINGSGGGGCMFAYAPGCEDAVAEAMRREGGIPYIVRVDEGAKAD